MQQSADTEWTIGRLLSWTGDYFKSKGVDEPTLSAQLLLSKVIGCSKVDLYLRYEQVVEKSKRDEFRELVKRAVEGEPIAYLVGHKEFFSLDFLVNRSVLIPRPETEILVQWVVRKVKGGFSGPGNTMTILDIGTGSGCIAISLAKYVPGSIQVTAVDKSPEAIELAKTNADRNKIKDIRFLVSDLFEAVSDQKRVFSFIVSNPPYITEEDYGRLPKNIKEYEPSEALVAGPDGLQVIRRIITQAGEFLKPGGFLVMEIGYNQREAVSKILEEQGYTDIEFERDGADIPRVVVGRFAEKN